MSSIAWGVASPATTVAFYTDRTDVAGRSSKGDRERWGYKRRYNVFVNLDCERFSLMKKGWIPRKAEREKNVALVGCCACVVSSNNCRANPNYYQRLLGACEKNKRFLVLVDLTSWGLQVTVDEGDFIRTMPRRDECSLVSFLYNPITSQKEKETDSLMQGVWHSDYRSSSRSMLRA